MHFGVDLGRCNPRLWLELSRAADELGDGWITMLRDDASFAVAIERLRVQCDRADRDFDAVERAVVVRDPDARAVDAWHEAGATRLIVAPWPRSIEAVDGLAAFRPVR